MPQTLWVTVRHSITGGRQNVPAEAVEQLAGLGWEPVTEPSEEKAPLFGDPGNGLPDPEPAPTPSEPEPLPEPAHPEPTADQPGDTSATAEEH